jgi:hypothetical protein
VSKLVSVGLFVCLFAVALDSLVTHAYPLGAPAGFTGGPGENTCVVCHSTYLLNAGRERGLGELVIEGLPDLYEPGHTYPVTVTLTQTKDRAYWGFQLAIRGQNGGAQAGELMPIDSHTQIVRARGLQYVESTQDGAESTAFQFTWVAPAIDMGPVLVSATGNAADGDDSPVGDFIYATSAILSPAPSH